MKNTLKEMLEALGVTESTLSREEAAFLDENGYVVMPGVLSTEQAAQMAARLDSIAAEEGEQAGTDFHTEYGTTRLGALVNKDPMFDVCFTHPRALAAVAHIMGDDFGLSSITGRAAQPGEGHQGLHRDDQDHCANALWVVSDFTEENGPTRLVPGSHRSTQAPHEGMADPLDSHPDEILLFAPAGTLVVIDGYTWHGGTKNNSSEPRHLVSAFFTQRDKYQGFAHRKVNESTRQRLSKAALYVLDHEPG
jgi:ectoine hydroxylase-related dioxygenase (phytanoyl-CoA dioxygenase family)